MRLPEYVDRGREAIDSLVGEISIGERSQVAPALRLGVEKNPEATKDGLARFVKGKEADIFDICKNHNSVCFIHCLFSNNRHQCGGSRP